MTIPPSSAEFRLRQAVGWILTFGVMWLILVLLALPAWYFGNNWATWSPYDYATLILPFVLWIGLTLSGIGAQSLSNVIELVGIVLLVPVLVSARIFLFTSTEVLAVDPAIVVLVLSCTVTVLLRLLMPCLPE